MFGSEKRDWSERDAEGSAKKRGRKYETGVEENGKTVYWSSVGVGGPPCVV